MWNIFKTFIAIGNLQNHMKCAHKKNEDSSELIYKCTQCSCAFENLKGLGHHMSRSHGIKINKTSKFDLSDLSDQQSTSENDTNEENSNSTKVTSEEDTISTTEKDDDCSETQGSSITGADNESYTQDSTKINGFVPVDGKEGKVKVVVREKKLENNKWFLYLLFKLCA